MATEKVNKPATNESQEAQKPEIGLNGVLKKLESTIGGTRNDEDLFKILAEGYKTESDETEKEILRAAFRGAFPDVVKEMEDKSRKEFLEKVAGGEITNPEAKVSEYIDSPLSVLGVGSGEAKEAAELILGMTSDNNREESQPEPVRLDKLAGEEPAKKQEETWVEIKEEKPVVGVAATEEELKSAATLTIDVEAKEVNNVVSETKVEEPKEPEVVVEKPRVDQIKKEDLATVSAKPRDFDQEYEKRKGLGPEVVQKWLADNADDLPDNLRVKIMDDLGRQRKGAEGFKVAEMEVTDEDYVQFREKMISKLKGVVSTQTDVEGIWMQLKSEFSQMKGLWSAKIPDKIEAELKQEYLARIELKLVLNYWMAVRAARSPEDDPFGVMEKSLTSCPTLSPDTYRWLMNQEHYLIMEGKGEDRETKEINFTQATDKALVGIYKRMFSEKSEINIWTCVGSDKENIIKKIADESEVSEDVVTLSWMLAEAEIWGAHEGANYAHPAYRVASFGDWRMQRFEKGLPVAGGIRIIQEWREAHGGKFPEKKSPERMELLKEIQKKEGRSLSRTGLTMWKGDERRGLLSAEEAVKEGRYLQTMKELFGDNVRSPQLLIMEDLGNGAAVFDLYNEMVGKTEVKKLSPTMIDRLKGKLYLIEMRLEGYLDGVDPGAAGPIIGNLLNEWSKSYLWGASWANTGHKDASGMDYVMTTDMLITHFRDLMLSYDPDKKYGINIGYEAGSSDKLKEFDKRINEIKYDKSISNESIKNSRMNIVEVEKKDYQHNEAVQEAKEFVKWFEGLLGKNLDYLKKRGGVYPDRRQLDVRGTALFDRNYWYGNQIVWGVRLPVLDKNDSRWWLRK